MGEIARSLERYDPPRSERRTPVRRVVAALAWYLWVSGNWQAPAGRLAALTSLAGAGSFKAVLRAIARLRRGAVALEGRLASVYGRGRGMLIR